MPDPPLQGGTHLQLQKYWGLKTFSPTFTDRLPYCKASAPLPKPGTPVSIPNNTEGLSQFQVPMELAEPNDSLTPTSNSYYHLHHHTY